jgi:hypothetical protein
MGLAMEQTGMHRCHEWRPGQTSYNSRFTKWRCRVVKILYAPHRKAAHVAIFSPENKKGRFPAPIFQSTSTCADYL